MRFFRRNPAFAAIAVGTLAFGIGGNTSIFTMVDALALRPLPYRDVDRIMAIETRKAQQPEVEAWTSMLDYQDMRAHLQTFGRTAAISPLWSVVLTGRGVAERLETLYVSGDFFPLLGVEAALGRTIGRDDNAARPAPAAVLSHAFWQRRFAGSCEILGQQLTLDNVSYTVIGVLPPGFHWAGEPMTGAATDIDVWLPLATNQLAHSIRSLRFLKVIGTRKPEFTVRQAREEVARFGSALAEQFPDSNRGYVVDASRSQHRSPDRCA